MDSKTVIILILAIVIVGLITNYVLSRRSTSCISQGYIPVDDANRIINLSNKLIVAVNYCYNQSEQLPSLNYFRGVN